MTIPGEISSLNKYVELATAIAEVAEGSSVRDEIAEGLEILGTTPADLYQLFIKELPPFASIYLSSDGNLGGSSRATIAGYFTALDIPIPSDPDHISALLVLLAQILESQLIVSSKLLGQGDDANISKLDSICRARDVLLNEHILSWLPAYLLRARQVGPSSLLGWVNYCTDLIYLLANENGFEFTDSQRFEPRREGLSSNEIVSWTTSPFLSGLIITYHDLEVVASKLNVSIRAGRKRFILEDLLSATGFDAIEQLCQIARKQGELYLSNCSDFPTLKIWGLKANRTSELLSDVDELIFNKRERV